MATQLEVYNQALVLIGDSPLKFLSGAPTGGAIQEVRLNRFFDSVRKAFIEGFTWNFAMRRTQLSRNATPPAFGWKYAYDKPPDALRVVNVWDEALYRYDCPPDSVPHEQEGAQILTDEENIFIRYLVDVGVETFPETAARALAAALAKEVVINITELQSKLGNVDEIYRKRLSKAKTLDSRQGPVQSIGPFSWDTVRNGGPGFSSRNILP